MTSPRRKKIKLEKWRRRNSERVQGQFEKKFAKLLRVGQKARLLFLEEVNEETSI